MQSIKNQNIMNKELTPMMELCQKVNDICSDKEFKISIRVISEIINELLPKEKQFIEEAFLDGYCTHENENTTSQDYYNTKFNNQC